MFKHFSSIVPVKDIVAQWDFMCFFEVIDTKDNGKIYPNPELEAPYIVVKLKR